MRGARSPHARWSRASGNGMRVMGAAIATPEAFRTSRRWLVSLHAARSLSALTRTTVDLAPAASMPAHVAYAGLNQLSY
jgi:hypothetical protein